MYSSIFALLSIAAATACGDAVPAPAPAPAPPADYSGSSAKFSLITIRSGSTVQNQAVKLASDGHLSLHGETDVTFELKGDILYANGNGVDLYQGFPVVKTDGTYSLTWGVDDTHLEFSESPSFAVCLDVNSNIAFTGKGLPSNCGEHVDVILHAVEN